MSFLPVNIRPLLDAGVNNSRQNFRLPHCYKVGSTRVKRCTYGTADLMAVTQVQDSEMLPMTHVRIEKNYEATMTTDEEAEVIAMAAPYAEGLEFNERIGNMYTYERMRSGHCHTCDREHDHDHSLFVTVHSGRVYIHCRREQVSSPN